MRDKGIEDIKIGDTYQSTSEKKKGNGFLKFLLVLLFIVILALGGLYYYNTFFKVVNLKQEFTNALSRK